ncbi:FecR family protein [Pseudomonas sp. CGJS7]|uniref:FecR family protein n=1 Tax=Pseudomonas sp. CGJS7 TaxID=3109348 RepID=UPI0030086C5D
MTPTSPPDSPDCPRADDADLGEQARRWIARLASGEMDEAELAAFETWMESAPQRAAFARQRALWQGLATLRDAFETAPAPEVATPAPLAPRRRGRRTRAVGWSLATAACLTAAIAAAPAIWLHWRADYRSGAAPQRYLLSDGSEAVLDAGSAITVDYRDGQRRIELLRGAAWFRVAHGDARPFRVEALNGVSRDIGTAFEVSLQDAQVRTAVSEGLVEVASAGGDAVGVRAGQAVVYAAGGAVSRPYPIDSADIAGWRHGELLLDGVPAERALQRIARYRAAPVWTVGSFAGAPRISATLRTDRPDEAIDAVARSARLRVQRLPSGVLLVRPPAE